jgi:hypothetical protein
MGRDGLRVIPFFLTAQPALAAEIPMRNDGVLLSSKC